MTKENARTMNHLHVAARKERVRESALLLLLVAGSLAIRIASFFQTHLFSRDGVYYLTMAESMKAGSLSFMEYAYHPLYPLLVALTESILPLDGEVCGRLVSLVLSSLTVIPVFFISKKLFGRKAAIISSLFFACHPHAIKFSTDVLSDPTYLFLFTSSVLFSLLLLANPASPLLAGTVGVVIALSYLTRPEGIGMLVVVCAWCLCVPWKQQKYPMSKRMLCSALICLSFFVVAFPYLYGIRKATGRWDITTKKNVTDWLMLARDKKEFHLSVSQRTLLINEVKQDGRLNRLIEDRHLDPDTLVPLEENRDLLRLLVVEEMLRDGIEATAQKYSLSPFILNVWNEQKDLLADRLSHPPPEPSPPSRVSLTKRFKDYALTLKRLVRSSVSAYHFFILLLPFGVFRRRSPSAFRKGELFIATVLLLYFYVLFQLHQVHYMSRRYSLPLAIIALPWAGVGLLHAADLIKRLSCRFFKRVSPERAHTTALLLLFTFTVPLLFPALKQRGEERLVLREIGTWIRLHCKPAPRILGTEPRITYFAHGTHLALPSHRVTLDYEELLDRWKYEKADLLVIDQEDLADLCPPFTARAADDPRLQLLKSFPYDRGRDMFLVYRGRLATPGSVPEQPSTK